MSVANSGTTNGNTTKLISGSLGTPTTPTNNLTDSTPPALGNETVVGADGK